METTTDRDSIPKLDEPELIKTDETRITKIAAPLLVVLTLGFAAVLTNTGLGTVPKFKELQPVAQGPVGLGLLLVVSALVFGIALVMSAELKARGEVAAANLSLRARPPLVFAPPGAAGTSAGLKIKRQGFGSDDEWTVVGAQAGDDGTTRLLVARGDDTAVWIPISEVTNWDLK